MGQTGQTVKIPLTVNMHIEAFSGGTITRLESGSKNLVYAQYADGRWYATQRPGINQIEDASGTTDDTRGRGCYFWDKVDDLYFVNNGTVYKGSYAGSTMDISAGTQRVFIGECGDDLVIIDSENNEGWTINASAPTTITAISDANFPPNQTPALTLARGGAVLNGKMYVITTDADIYESDIEDATSWNGLNFINAEIAPDGGVALARHFSQLIAFGSRTMQFFEDTANPVGSTLTARTDIQYDVGALDTDSIWKVGEDLYFVGQDSSGNIGVYALVNFSLNKVSTNDLDTFLTTAVTQDKFGLLGCGLTSGGREFYVLSIIYTGTIENPAIYLHDPKTGDFLIDSGTGKFLIDSGIDQTLVTTATTASLVFSANRQWWGIWECSLFPDVRDFPLMSWIQSPKAIRAGEGMFLNGDLITILDDFNPVDAISASEVYEADVYEPDVYTVTGSSGSPVEWQVITGVTDGGSHRRKFMGDLWLIHTPTSESEMVDVDTADEQNATFTRAGEINASDSYSRINRLGSFRRRNFKVSGTLSEQIRMESLAATVRIGQQ